MSSEYIFDIINEMDICKVNSVYIREMKNTVYNIAYAYVELWYKGSKDIRDNLNRGEVMYIQNLYGADLEAYKFIYKKNKQSHPEKDEFGRDVPRHNNNNTVAASSTSAKEPPADDSDKSSEYSLPSQHLEFENKKAADEFIANYI